MTFVPPLCRYGSLSSIYRQPTLKTADRRAAMITRRSFLAVLLPIVS
jgi:hypothetical protein